MTDDEVKFEDEDVKLKTEAGFRLVEDEFKEEQRRKIIEAKRKKAKADQWRITRSIIKGNFDRFGKFLIVVNDWIITYTSGLMQTLFRYLTAFSLFVAIYIAFINYDKWIIVLSMMTFLVVLGWLNKGSDVLSEEFMRNIKKISESTRRR